MVTNNPKCKSFLLLSILAVSIITLTSCKTMQSGPKTVTVYVSQDQAFSEPILNDFEKETGIKVLAVYDNKKDKNTNVLSQLIAEKDAPRADVYWSNEPITAEILKEKEISAPYVSKNAKEIPDVFKDADGYWTGFSARARVLVVNNSVKNKPTRIDDYLDSSWKGKAVIANPVFGDANYHITALFTVWKDMQTKEFMKEMKRNKVVISPNSGESVDFVAAGQYGFSLVDSNDAVNRIRQGRPITIVYPDQKRNQIGCLVIPNAAMLIKGSRHSKEAKALIDYLLSKETQQKLALSGYAGIPLSEGVQAPPELKPISEIKVMKVDYAKIAKKAPQIQSFLEKWVWGSKR